MTRPSQALLGVHKNCALPENADRWSMSFPVTSFTVYPSRRTCANETLRLIVSLTIGPDAPPRTAHAPWLPNGRDSDPAHFSCDGRVLVMFTRPPSVFRPKSAL